MNKKTVNIILIVILILGSFLRVYKIGSESFWVDESATVYTTQEKASSMVYRIYTTNEQVPEDHESGHRGGGTPPFYFVLANYWTKLVGLSEARLRLLSAIFGIISLYIIFLIGRNLFDYKTGLISAFLMSINYMHIKYSQEARTYSWIILLTLLTVYFLINALRQKKKMHWIAYILSSSMLIYSNYFGFFILIFEYLFLLIFWKEYRDSLSAIIISGISIFLLYAPWLPALIRQMKDTKLLIYLLGQNIPLDLVRILVQFCSWFNPDLETRRALSSLYHYSPNSSLADIFGASFLGVLTIISILAFASIMWWCFISSIAFKNNKLNFDNIKDKKYVLLLMWFIVPLLMPITLTLLFPKSPVFGFVQHVLIASPAFYLIASNGILKSKKFYSLLVLLAVLSVLPLYSYYSNIDKQQWRETANYLKSNRNPSELVIVYVPTGVLPLEYYYKDMNRVTGIKKNISQLKSEVKREDSVWLVYASEILKDPEGTIKNYMDMNYKLEKQKDFVGIRVFHYVKNTPS